MNFVKSDLIDRIYELDKNVSRILIIRDNDNYISNDIIKRFNAKDIIYIEDEDEDMPNNDQFDMIIFPFGMHYTKDVPKFLKSASSILKDDGILAGNFPSAGSLNNLRSNIYKLEDNQKLHHYSHVIPMIRFDDMTPLLQQAGFVESIIDVERIELEFLSPLELMKALKRTANNNILQHGVHYSITKEMYKLLAKEFNDSFIDEIFVINFVACKQKKSITLKEVY